MAAPNPPVVLPTDDDNKGNPNHPDYEASDRDKWHAQDPTSNDGWLEADGTEGEYDPPEPVELVVSPVRDPQSPDYEVAPIESWTVQDGTSEPAHDTAPSHANVIRSDQMPSDAGLKESGVDADKHAFLGGDFDGDGNVDSNELSEKDHYLRFVKQNSAPTASDQEVDVDGGGSVEITLVGEDPDGGAVTFVITDSPSRGSLSDVEGDKVTYTTTETRDRDDEFKFKAVDDEGTESTEATVSIAIHSTDTGDDGDEGDD